MIPTPPARPPTDWERCRRPIGPAARRQCRVRGCGVCGWTIVVPSPPCFAFQGLDDLWVGLAVNNELLEPLSVDGGKASRKHCFLRDRGHYCLSLGVDTERSVSCTKHARHRANENAKF